MILFVISSLLLFYIKPIFSSCGSYPVDLGNGTDLVGVTGCIYQCDTASPDPVYCPTLSTAHGATKFYVWTWTPPASGTYTFTTDGTPTGCTDTVLRLIINDVIGPSNDDCNSCINNRASLITISLTVGDRVIILGGSFNDNCGVSAQFPFNILYQSFAPTTSPTSSKPSISPTSSPTNSPTVQMVQCKIYSQGLFKSIFINGVTSGMGFSPMPRIIHNLVFYPGDSYSTVLAFKVASTNYFSSPLQSGFEVNCSSSDPSSLWNLVTTSNPDSTSMWLAKPSSNETLDVFPEDWHSSFENVLPTIRTPFDSNMIWAPTTSKYVIFMVRLTKCFPVETITFTPNTIRGGIINSTCNSSKIAEFGFYDYLGRKFFPFSSQVAGEEIPDTSLLDSDPSTSLELIPNLSSVGFYMSETEQPMCLSEYELQTSNTNDSSCQDPISWTITESSGGILSTINETQSNVPVKRSAFTRRFQLIQHDPNIPSPNIKFLTSRPYPTSVRLSDTLSTVIVDFDQATNQVPTLIPSSVCSSYLSFEGSNRDTGCSGRTPCPLTCYWPTASRMVVNLHPSSDFLLTPSPILRMLSNSGVRNLQSTSGNAFFDEILQPALSPSAVSVLISGPTTISLCSLASTVLTASVVNAGNRVPEYQWYLSSFGSLEPIAGASLNSFTLGKPAEPKIESYVVGVKRWIDSSFILSGIFNVTYTSVTIATVVLTAPSTFTTPATSTIEIASMVNLPGECINGTGTALYNFRWSITRVEDGANFSSVTTTTSSKIKVSPASLLPPGFNYRFDLHVDTGLGIFGSTFTTAFVAYSPIVAQLVSPKSFSVERSSRLDVDATKSCDPNLVTPFCHPLSGLTSGSSSNMEFTWSCKTRLNNDCSQLCSTSSGKCAIGNFTLNVTESPYIFRASVTSSLNPALAAVFTNEVEVTVLPELAPSCVRPRISMNPFPTKINVGGSGEAALQSIVENFAPSISEGKQYVWTVSVDEGQENEPSSLVGSGVSTNQQNLVLQLKQLLPGSTYRFRLTATLPCTAGSNPFGEITFQTNSPPTGGVLSVSPLSGRAAVDDFTLNCQSFTDTDLPLNFLFEYRTNFDPEIAPEAAFLSLSSYSEVSTLKTQFAASHRILILCRARDSLQATSPRPLSPYVDNINVTALVIGADTPSAQSQIDNLLSSGGSSDDTLRFAIALTSSSSSADTPEAQQWLRDAQSSLLDAIAGSRDPEGPPPDPSFISLQASALSSILGAAADVQDASSPEGALFLQNAAALAGNILTDALASIKAKGGENNPTLSQYIPSNLGSMTLDTLKSVLLAIQRSFSESNSRRRRRLSNEAQNTVTTVRQKIRQLVDVMLLGAVSGSAPRLIPGAEMKIVTVREVPGQIGAESKLSEISVPAFNENDPPTIFTLPKNLLQGKSDDALVDIIAVRFRINVRELIESSIISNDTEALASNVTEILALDFQANSSVAPYHPENLENFIGIRIPITIEDLPKDNTTELSCGYWNETVNGWSSYGCNVTDAKIPTLTDPDGWMLCECNHASDYAAWQAFIRDISTVFVPVDLTRLSLISAVVVGVMLPSLVLLYLIFTRYASKKDEVDSEAVHLGTFVAVTRKKLQLHDRQRRFFRILRENAQNGKFSVKKELAIAIERKHAFTGVMEKKFQMQHQSFRRTNRAESKEVIANNDLEQEVLQQLEDEERDNKKYVKDFMLHIFRFVGVTSFLASIFFVIGLSSANFDGLHESPSSLSSIYAENEVFTVTYAMTIISLIAHFGMFVFITVILYIRRSRALAILTNLFVFETLITPFSIAAFAVPLSNGVPIGSGLGLIIAGGSTSIILFLSSAFNFFLRKYEKRAPKLLRSFISNIARGMFYEQTLVSIVTRFDPYFDREKRVAIVLAVVVGNLFAGAFFYGLKSSSDISIGLAIGTVLLSSFIVAVPVKLAIRFLLRVTDNKRGSRLDRVAQIFRVIAFSNDVSPQNANEAEKSDTIMLERFKQYYLASHRYTLLKSTRAKQQQIEDDLRRVQKGLPPKGTHEYYMYFAVVYCVLCLAISTILFFVGASQSTLNSSPFSLGLAAGFIGSFNMIINLYLICSKSKRVDLIFQLSIMLHLITISLGYAAFASYETVLVEELFLSGAIITTLGAICAGYAIYVFFFTRPEHLEGTERFVRKISQERENSIGKPEAGNPILTKETMQTMNVNNSSAEVQINPKTGEQFRINPLHLRDGESLESAISHSSRRFLLHTQQVALLQSHSLLKDVPLESDGKISKESIINAKNELALQSKELTRAIQQAQDKRKTLHERNLNHRQVNIRNQEAVLLKLANLLAEETTYQPFPVRRILRDKLRYVSWFLLFAYFFGGLFYITYWIFSRDAKSVLYLQESEGIAEPTKEQISIETNAVLLGWLGNAFLGMFLGYFVAEPLVIILRYGVFKLIVDMVQKEEKKPLDPLVDIILNEEQRKAEEKLIEEKYEEDLRREEERMKTWRGKLFGRRTVLKGKVGQGPVQQGRTIGHAIGDAFDLAAELVDDLA